MRRSTFNVVVAIVLGLFGLYVLSYIPPMLAGTPPAPLLAAGFVIQACAALLAAVGVWVGAAWAPGAVLVLGIAIAVTECAEAFLVGVIPYDHALLVSVIAILLALFVAGIVRKPREVIV